jgi:hypothetical protein
MDLVHSKIVPVVALLAIGCGIDLGGDAAPIDDGTTTQDSTSTTGDPPTTMTSADDDTTPDDDTSPDDDDDTSPPTTNDDNDDDDDDDDADESTTDVDESSSSTTGPDPVACAAYFGCSEACDDDPVCIEGCAEFTMADVEACIEIKCDKLYEKCGDENDRDACQEITELCLPVDETTGTSGSTGNETTGAETETGTGTETGAGTSTTAAE